MPRSHYLAQCYLRGFATREDHAAIWQYEKSTGILCKRGIRNVAYKNNYYSRKLRSGNFDHRLESFFSRFESRWPSIRQALGDHVRSGITSSDVQLLTREQITVLLQFILIHRMRMPKQIEWMREYVTTNHPLAEMLTERVNQNIIIDALQGSLDDVVAAWVAHNVRKAMVILFAPAGSKRCFFTTDNPVTYEGDIREESTVLVFPASRRMVIGFWPVQDDGALVRVIVVRNDVDLDRANHDIIANAWNGIYATEPFYLERLLKDLGCPVERRVAGG